MADVSVNIYQSVTNRDGVSTPVSGVITGDPLPPVVNPPTGTFNGIGITINGKNIGGVKNYILESETVDIPSNWEYNLFKLTVDGFIDVDELGTINIMEEGIFSGVGSPILQEYVSVSADYLADTTDRIIEATTPLITVTLPTANVSNLGYQYKIDNSSGGAIFVVGEGGETINGIVSQTVPNNSCINVFANGTAWRIS